MPDTLLARAAEGIFWLARYVERAENLARILDVNATFARDRSGGQNWLPVVQINADEARFFAVHETASADSVLQFYLTDRENPTSIASAIDRAHQNARTLRPRMPREMWAQLNVFRKRTHDIDVRALEPGNLARLFHWIRESCQTHVGIVESTLYRDQAWHFHRIGGLIERADQTTRLLDIKYHLLLPTPSDVGSSIDLSQWNALLRSAAGYHASRRVEAGNVTPAGVAGLLLLDPSFPRSAAYCIAEAARLLTAVRSRPGLVGGAEAAARFSRLQAMLGSVTIGDVLAGGLHEFLDLVQQHLIAVTNDFAAAFFGVMPPAAPPAELASGQQQRQ